MDGASPGATVSLGLDARRRARPGSPGAPARHRRARADPGLIGGAEPPRAGRQHPTLKSRRASPTFQGRDGGQLRTANLVDERVPRALDELRARRRCVFAENGDGPFGAKGRARAASSSRAQRWQCARRTAGVGVRFRDLPLTPEACGAPSARDGPRSDAPAPDRPRARAEGPVARRIVEGRRAEGPEGISLAFRAGTPTYVPGSTRSPTTAAPAPTTTSCRIRTRSLTTDPAPVADSREAAHDRTRARPSESAERHVVTDGDHVPRSSGALHPVERASSGTRRIAEKSDDWDIT